MTIEQNLAPLFFKSVFANAIFSGMSGVSMMLLSAPIAAFIGYANSQHIFWIGIFLVAFSARMFFASYTKRISKTDAVLVTAGDFLWVIGSLWLLMTNPGLFSRTGVVVVAAVAVVVFVFAELQTASLLRFRRQAKAS